MNILMLMAGSSQAFKESGHPHPRSLVEIDGVPLFEHVIGSYRGLITRDARVICCVLREENETFHIGRSINLTVENAVIVEIPGATQGAACSALLAIDLIGSDEPLLIVNGDQVVEADLAAIVETFSRDGVDGGIVVFDSVHPRWSYVRLGADGHVVEAAEKKPISRLATAGIYYFRRGRDFVEAAQASILKDAHVNGVFYVCPLYNELVLRQQKIAVYPIDRTAYHSMATPQGVQDYERRLRERGGRTAS